MPDNDVVLATRDLVKEYVTGRSSVRALDGVTFEVPRGRFVAVMGPSGSGKSTLLHLLGGLDAPTSGQVWLEGQALADLGDRQLTLARRNRIGFVFQFFNLVPVLTIEENIALPLIIGGARPKEYVDRIERILKLVGLTEWRTHLPSEISGGQQQRVAVARALVTEPAVLLADEPTGNLDQKTGNEVLTLLREVQRALGQTVVIVTHDAHAAGFADEVVLLVDGKIKDRLTIDEQTHADGSAVGGERRAQAVLAWLQAAGA
ncbi:MAG: ABC transporter ATP-binding protein [Actinomycetota bacterium]